MYRAPTTAATQLKKQPLASDTGLSISPRALSTGSSMSRQPPGGAANASTGAGNRIPKSPIVTTQPTYPLMRSRSGLATSQSTWLSTSSRPIGGSGSNLMSPVATRIASPPQPPPLPPPPPSPQLVPLKARLARSRSIPAHPVHTGLGPTVKGARRRWEDASSRRSAFGQGTSRSLKEPLDAAERTPPIYPSGDGDKSLEKPGPVPYSTPGAFSPIAHPRERNAVTVCLASLVFLTVSVLITSLVSAIILPLCLCAYLIRHLGRWLANLRLDVRCCQCNWLQRHRYHSAYYYDYQRNPIASLLARFVHPTEPRADQPMCQCARDHVMPNPTQPIRLLTPAELRWLPVSAKSAITTAQNNVDNSAPTLSPPVIAPVIVICLRFGAPGVRLSRLREVFATRLLLRPIKSESSPSLSSTSSPRDSGSFGEESQVTFNRPSNGTAPLDEALSRLTQCLTSLPTGYAWRECLAFRLEEHVIPVPSGCIPKPPSVSEKRRHGRLSRSSSSSTAFDTAAVASSTPHAVRVESMVESLNSLPMQLNRPLWQAYLLEQFQEITNIEQSDLESGAESDGPTEDPLPDRDYGNSSSKARVTSPSGSSASKPPKWSKTNQSDQSKSTGPVGVNSTTPVCRRSGVAGVGSLLVLRLHAALSDNSKALVQLITNCLADSPSRTHSPLQSSVTVSTVRSDFNKPPNKPKWRGPRMTDTSESPSPRVTTEQKGSSNCLTNKPNTPSRSYLNSPTSRPTGSTGSQAQTPSSTTASTNHVTPSTTTTSSSSSTPTATTASACPDEDDREESEAAQWWYMFWSSSLATIATCCDLVRAILTGAAVICHKYFFTRADMGLLAKWSTAPTMPSTTPMTAAGQQSRQPRRCPDGNSTTSNSSSMCNSRLASFSTTTGNSTPVAQSPSSSVVESSGSGGGLVGENRLVYKTTLLSLVKLSRVRQVTKASYSEIILSLLAGGLRAYQQTVGLKHPPDLLAFLSVEVPVLPGCSINSLQSGYEARGYRHRSPAQGCDTTPCSGIARLWSQSQGNMAGATSSSVQRLPTDIRLESGLNNGGGVDQQSGNTSHVAPLLCPGRHVLADICLPLNTEGMLPRLWETRQRLIELNNSVDPLCLAWARSILYTVMPHMLAGWVEATFGSSAKASVSVTGVEVVSPFNGQHRYTRSGDQSPTYQMPPTRRLAYMSLLASKSAEARTSIRRHRLRKRVLPRGTRACPPRLGTSFRAIARHLTHANAGLVYIAGSPVVRVDTWMPSPRMVGAQAGGLKTIPSPVQPSGATSSPGSTTQWIVCRDLSLSFTTYAGQLSLTLSANAALDKQPNLDSILISMRIQLRKLCRLLAGRHVPTATDRWLSQSSNFDPRGPTSVSSTSAVNLSPSLNPTVVLHQDSSPRTEKSKGTQPHEFNGRNGKSSTSPSHSPVVEKTCNQSSMNVLNKTTVIPIESQHPSIAPCGQESSRINRIDASSNQFFQPTEQLQSRLRWVQQQLMIDSPGRTISSTPQMTEKELTELRAEFCALLRELKQRCSIGAPLHLTPEWYETPIHDPSELTGAIRVSPCLSRNRPVENATHPGGKRRSSAERLISAAIGGVITPTRPVAIQQPLASLSGGDFDEDPDFYIDGCNGGDEDDDDLSTEEEEEENSLAKVESLTPTPSPHHQVSTKLSDTVKQPRSHSKHSLLAPRRTEATRAPTLMEIHTKQQKRRRTTSVHQTMGRRRASLLSTDLASLDITPTRRGSLSASSTGSANEGGLLARLVRPKFSAALFTTHSSSPCNNSRIAKTPRR